MLSPNNGGFMRFIDFDSMSDFTEKLIQVSVASGDKNRYCGVAVCNYEVATGLLEELAKRSQKFRHIDLSAPEVSGYLKEYAIMVTEKGIYCEKCISRIICALILGVALSRCTFMENVLTKLKVL